MSDDSGQEKSGEPLSAEYFEGFADRECGEHRTVGSHRAWCYACSMWCYPASPCAGCELPMLRAKVAALTGLLREVRDHIAMDDAQIFSEWEQGEYKPAAILDRLDAVLGAVTAQHASNNGDVAAVDDRSTGGRAE